MQDCTIFCVSMCLYFVELVFRWVFLRGFFLCFFPLVGVGQHLPKSCRFYVPPALYCVCCFVLVVIMTFSSGVHRAPYLFLLFLLVVIMTFSSGVHRAPYLILADACVQHISCV